MPRGPDFKVPVAEVLAAHRAHLRGHSLRSLARLHCKHWGYSTPGTAVQGLSAAMKALDLPVRDRVAAVVAAKTVHGDYRTALRDPAHPEHERYLARRRATA